jgi:integrase/recombinase XerC/integrase/recombinase XerD
MKQYPNIAKGIKSPKRKNAFRKQALTPGQSRELLTYFKTQCLMDYAIANLLLRTGLRTIEIVRANT